MGGLNSEVKHPQVFRWWYLSLTQPNLGHHFTKAGDIYIKKPRTTLCPVQLLHVCHSKSLQKRLQESKDQFWVFCHSNRVMLLSSFRAQCRENSNLHPPCRAVTEWHLLSNSYLYFPAKLWDQQQQQQHIPRNWEALTDLCTRCCILKVSSFTFHLNYTLIDICLNQLFE